MDELVASLNARQRHLLERVVVEILHKGKGVQNEVIERGGPGGTRTHDLLNAEGEAGRSHGDLG
jgi:hypothetical protein